MGLNTLKPAKGSTHTKKRLGRGIGSGLGKTSGRGHKGQKARAGGFHKLGFEGGQMPLQRRLPKTGFTSRVGQKTIEVRLGTLNKLQDKIVDIAVLRNNGIIAKNIKRVKIFLSGELTRPITLKGLKTTKGVKEYIEKNGGEIIE